MNSSRESRPGVPCKLSAEDRTALEASIAAQRRGLSELIDQLNSAVFALTLPDELLGAIFRYYIAAWQATIRDRESYRPEIFSFIAERYADVHGWATLTHVCRRWRQLALQDPSLWTRICVSTAEPVRSYLERSRDMPLEVEGMLEVTPTMSKDVLEAWRLVFRQSHRICSLKLSYSFAEMGTAPEQAIRQIHFDDPQFSNLKRLSVFAIRSDQSTALPPMLETLKSHHVLETLRTSCLPLSITCGLFSPHIRHLEFHNTLHRPSNVDLFPTLHTLLAALKRLPQLDTLKLTDSFPPYDTAAPWEDLLHVVEEPVNLPHLSFLQISCSHNLIPAAVLTLHLVIPALTPLTMHMTTSYEENECALGWTLAAKASAAENAVPPAPLRTIAVTSRPWPFRRPNVSGRLPMVLTAWTERCSGSSGCSIPSPQSRLLEAQVPNARGQAFFDFIVRPLPMKSVGCVSLALCNAPENSGDFGLAVRSAFASATSVDTLVIREGDGLQWLPDVLLPPRNSEVVFPKLETLHFYEVSFIAQGDDAEDDWEWRTDMCKRWWEDLAASLYYRSEEGSDLKKIVITASRNIYRHNVEMLRGYVHEITWDGCCMGDNGSDQNWAWADFEESG